MTGKIVVNFGCLHETHLLVQFVYSVGGDVGCYFLAPCEFHFIREIENLAKHQQVIIKFYNEY